MVPQHSCTYSRSKFFSDDTTENDENHDKHLFREFIRVNRMARGKRQGVWFGLKTLESIKESDAIVKNAVILNISVPNYQGRFFIIGPF